MNKAPFLTGSHAYGKPRPDSDIDLVVWTDTPQLKELLEAGGYPVRFGNLNLILVDDDKQWLAWLKGTQDLIIMRHTLGRPITRDEAVEHLKNLRKVAQDLVYSEIMQAGLSLL